MKVIFTNQFDKTTSKIRDEGLVDSISFVIRQVLEAQHSQEIHNLKKLSGYKTTYRIRIQNYRIGILIKNGTVTFAVFAHRKDIYKLFP